MQRRLRLRRSSDFHRLRNEGRTYRHRTMILSLIPNALPHNRYGFITGRRVGPAVVRNRVRRHLREAVRLLHPRLEQGYDIAIIARPGLVNQPFVAVQQILTQLFDQSGLLLVGDPS